MPRIPYEDANVNQGYPAPLPSAHRELWDAVYQQKGRVNDLAKAISLMADAVELIGSRVADLEQQVSDIQYPRNPMEE